MMAMHYVSICYMSIHSSIYYIHYEVYTIYMYAIWLYTTCICTTHLYAIQSIYFVWCLYIIYVYELCVSVHCMSIYYIWYLYTYMCLYTLELGKQTDPWRLLASLANQWTPGSVKDTRKSDREGLLTLTSGLHTYTQI